MLASLQIAPVALAVGIVLIHLKVAQHQADQQCGYPGANGGTKVRSFER